MRRFLLVVACTVASCSSSTPQKLTAAPVVASVAGNGSDASHVEDGLIVTGTELAQATFGLRDDVTRVERALTARSQGANRAELMLPADVRSGSYHVIATNSAGSASAPVTLTLPEVTPAIVLERLNTATGTIALERLPRGPSSGLDADTVDGRHAGDFVFAGSDVITPDQLWSSGLYTNVARGAPVTVDSGTLLGAGPAGEHGMADAWTTSTFPATITFDLGQKYWLEYVTFEGWYRSDPQNLPEYQGNAAYVLEWQDESRVWHAVAPVAPSGIGGTAFVHRLQGQAVALRLKVVQARIVGNAVNVSSFRALSFIAGDGTAVQADRLYAPGRSGGPFCMFAKDFCPGGAWTSAGEACFALSKSGSATAPFTRCPYREGDPLSAPEAGNFYHWCCAVLCCRGG